MSRGSWAHLRPHALLSALLACVVTCALAVCPAGSPSALERVRAQRTAVALPLARASVVGGTGASIAGLPFVVALYDPRAGSPAAGFFCGGVIVDATHVATAAHCVVEASGGALGAGRVAVLAGSTTLAPVQAGSVTDPVQASTFDRRYEPASSDYDVALLKLARPLWSGATPSVNGINRIAPLSPDQAMAARYGNPNAPSAVTVTAGGWGDVNPAPGGRPSYPMGLREVRMPLVSDGMCEEQYAFIEQPITPRMICAGGGRSHLDTCYGDSGGPLVADSSSPPHPPSDYVLVGLVDFGNGCAQSGFAGVYTRIASAEVMRFLESGVGRTPRSIASQVKHRKKRHKRHKRHL
ncbi:MAG: serine protease [Solirubrobacteraceae bacterium]